METIHKPYTGLCQHKTFYGMLNGHCVKCGKPFKNCEKCYPVTSKLLPTDWKKEWKKIRDTGVDEKMSQFYDRVEAFISKTLASQRQEIREKIEGLKVENNKLYDYTLEGMGDGYEMAKSDILSLLGDKE